MTDLSKQLGEIKRRDVSDAAQPYAGINKMQALNDRSRLLHIIEVEIPGMLRARATALHNKAEQFDDKGDEVTAAACRDTATELSLQAALIESLTKKEEG